MTSPQEREPEPAEYDSVFLNSRKEAIFIFGIWVIAFLWAVPYSYLNGYPENFEPETFTTILGIPSWLFWGIAVPWIAADVVTTWFCFCYMKDDDLGETHEGADIEEDLEDLAERQSESGGDAPE